MIFLSENISLQLVYPLPCGTKIMFYLKLIVDKKCHISFLDERFEYARKLKNSILKLRVAGEKLGKYELEKRHAIEMEDYEKARQKKTQMDQFRIDIYQDLSVEQLLERDGVC